MDETRVPYFELRVKVGTVILATHVQDRIYKAKSERKWWEIVAQKPQIIAVL